MYIAELCCMVMEEVTLHPNLYLVMKSVVIAQVWGCTENHRDRFHDSLSLVKKQTNLKLHK